MYGFSYTIYIPYIIIFVAVQLLFLCLFVCLVGEFSLVDFLILLGVLLGYLFGFVLFFIVGFLAFCLLVWFFCWVIVIGCLLLFFPFLFRSIFLVGRRGNGYKFISLVHNKL